MEVYVFPLVQAEAGCPRKVFVSYHHAVDQRSYFEFVQRFATRFETVTNRSIAHQVDSERPGYVMRKIREEHIRGSSCIIVLCGRETPWRKYIDWEIKAALDREHGLIGINLPGNRARYEGRIIVPGRLHDNIESEYAVWIQWPELEKGPSISRK